MDCSRNIDFCRKCVSATASCFCLCLSLLIVIELYINLWTINWTSNSFFPLPVFVLTHCIYPPVRSFISATLYVKTPTVDSCVWIFGSPCPMWCCFILWQSSLKFSKCCEKVVNLQLLQEVMIECANQQIFPAALPLK